MSEKFENIRLLSVISDRDSTDADVEKALAKWSGRWTELDRLIETNRVRPQAAGNIARRGMLTLVPGALRPSLEKARREAAVYGMLAQDTARMVLDAAAEARIDLAPLKGASLIGRIYEPGERAVSDIDFLTREECAADMADIFLRLGFDKIDGDLSERFEDVFSGEKKFGIERGGAMVVAELHWNVSPGRALRKNFPLEADRLWGAPDSDGRPAIGPEMEIVYLLHHLAVRHSFCRLMWILDIKYLLAGSGAAMDFNLMESELRRAGLGKPAWLLGWLIKEILGGEAPDALFFNPPPDIVKKALRALAIDSLSGGPMKTSGLLPGLLAQRPYDYYLRWLFPGREFLRERYPGKPEALLTIYRAGDLAGKILGGLRGGH